MELRARRSRFTAPKNRSPKYRKRVFSLETLSLVGLGWALTMTSWSCDAPESRFDLNPEGPPMVRQVFMTEVDITTSGVLQRKVGQLAFGTHSDISMDDDDGVVSAAAIRGAQEIRIILDETIRGTRLEEAACADGSFSPLLDGTTPDDVADCSGAPATLTSCTNVCLGDNDTPTGILDVNEDGAADIYRMIDYNPDEDIVDLGVQVVCDGASVPMSQALSFWNPSGNQTMSTNPGLAYRGLGPVIVLRSVAGIGMPSRSDCTLQFHPNVVDYDGNEVCAPAGGFIENDCSPGDTTEISFGTEAMAVTNTIPLDGAMNVALDSSGFVRVFFNTNLHAEIATGIVGLTANEVVVPIEAVVSANSATDLAINLVPPNPGDPAPPFEPETTYVLSIGAGLRDRFGKEFGQDLAISWTTAMAAPPAAAAP